MACPIAKVIFSPWTRQSLNARNLVRKCAPCWVVYCPGVHYPRSPDTEISALYLYCGDGAHPRTRLTLCIIQEAHAPWHSAWGLTWPLAKFPEAPHAFSFYWRGSILSLFSFYGQRFSRYKPIFKIPYLGMKLGPWLKFQKFHIYALSTHTGSNRAYFHSTSCGFPDTGRFSKLPIWAWNLTFGKNPRRNT